MTESANQARRLRVALVMPVRNEEAAVDETMQAILNSTRLPDEIVVADALSVDATRARIEAWTDKGIPLRVVDNPTIYCGGGRNVGFRHTDCDVMLIVDFGNPIFPEYIEEMVRPFEEQEGVDVTMGILQPLMKTPFERCMGILYYDENMALPDLTLAEKNALLPKVLLPGGGCIGMTRDFWKSMGGYPEWLARSQDRLFSRKAYCRDAKVVVAWDAYCYNHVRNSGIAVYRMAYSWSRCNGQSRYIRKHLLKVVPFYIVVLGLAGASALWWPGLPLAVLLLSAYIGRSGLRRLWRFDGGVRHLSDIWHASRIIIAGDLGTIAGHLVGWGEWFLKPHYRRLFWEYMAGCPRDRIHIVER